MKVAKPSLASVDADAHTEYVHAKQVHIGCTTMITARKPSSQTPTASRPHPRLITM